MARDKRDVILTFRVSGRLADIVGELAEKNDRTVSSYLERLVREYIAREKGIDAAELKSPPKSKRGRGGAEGKPAPDDDNNA